MTVWHGSDHIVEKPEYSILNWLAVLARYRSYWQKASLSEAAKSYLQENFFVDPEEYDVIIGYRTDDSYFSFAQDFVAGALSLEQLSEAMHLGRRGEQVVLKSRRSFQRLSFLGAESADADIWYEKKSARDLENMPAYSRDFSHELAGKFFCLKVYKNTCFPCEHMIY